MIDPVGQKIGTIRIEGHLGHGGVGEVYSGWDEHLERRVALKAVRRDRSGGEARARLLREARILSRLDDPKICQLFDYLEGEESDWLVLELVDGETLADVDTHALSVDRRLEIAQQIAEVLVETHAKGIIHRDLKPSNVMLTSGGSVKVLDFGIARWSGAVPLDLEPAPGHQPTPAEDDPDGGEPGHEVRTSLGQVLGTILYMSPEQARGEPLTTASDLYSFGLLLQEILTGEPPYPPGEPPPLLLARVARGERPSPAGDALPAPFDRWISELTRLDPGKRPSAAKTVRRISHHRARPQRLRRRAVAVILLALALSAGVRYTWSLRATLRESIAARADAERARIEAQELSSFLAGLFTAPRDGPRGEPSAEPLTARRILERGAERLEREFADRPPVRARLAFTLGEVFQSLGEYPRSRELHEASLALRRSLAEPDPAAVAESLDALGTAHRFEGDYPTAADHFERALALRESLFGPGHVDVASTLNGLAIVERRQGDYEAAEAHYLRALAIREAALGPDDPSVAKALNNLALLYYYQGRLDDAETLYRRALDIKQATLDPHHPSIAQSLNNLGNLLADQERYAEAEDFYRRSLAIWEQAAGPDHPQSASSANNLGLLFHESGQWELAEEYLKRAVAIRRQALGPHHPDYASSLSNLGALDVARRRFDEAEERLSEALAAQLEALGPEHADVGLTFDRLATAALGRGDVRGARERAQRALAINRADLGPDHPDTALSIYLLALCDLADGDPDAAHNRLTQVLAIYDDAGLTGTQRANAQAALDYARALHTRTEAQRQVATWVAPGEPGPGPR